jgi:molybdopterin-guanine dinucleotide biosynthesis protein A
MRVIILAAGQSRRFQQEGYTVPKPFLSIEWRGTTATMLEHVIATVPLGFPRTVVAVPKPYAERLEGALELTGRIVRFVEVEYSRGPGHTALQVLEFLQLETTLFLDVDVLNCTNDLYRLVNSNSCGVLVAKSTDPACWYVDKIDRFNRIIEKERISSYAVQGAYFVPITQIPDLMLCLSAAIRIYEEPFLSHAFNQMMGSKLAVQTSYAPVDWGTPEKVRLSGAHIIPEKGNSHFPTTIPGHSTV